MSIAIFDKESGNKLGDLDETQFEDLTELLESEGAGDRDRFVNREAVEYLTEEGADPGLIKFLLAALGERESVELEWKED